MRNLLIIILLSITSCSATTQYSDFMNQHFRKEDYNPENFKNAKVQSRKKIEIHQAGTESKTVVLSNGELLSPFKIRSVEYFNTEGLCTLKIIPKYSFERKDTSGYHKLSVADQLFFRYEIETNIPTGFNDSVFFYYDELNRLISKENHEISLIGIQNKYTQTYEYDSQGNMTRSCLESSTSRNYCHYRIFTYDKKGQIVSIRDSSTATRRNSEPFTESVTYNENGYIKSIGNKYFYYDKNLLSEEHIILNNVKTNITRYFYDQNGSCLREEHVKAGLSEFDPSTGVQKIYNYDTAIIINFFNDKKLITQYEYWPTVKSKSSDLFKFEYSFY